VIARLDVDDEPVIVTEFLPDFVNLRDWLGSSGRGADDRGDQDGPANSAGQQLLSNHRRWMRRRHRTAETSHGFSVSRLVRARLRLLTLLHRPVRHLPSQRHRLLVRPPGASPRCSARLLNLPRRLALRQRRSPRHSHRQLRLYRHLPPQRHRNPGSFTALFGAPCTTGGSAPGAHAAVAASAAAGSASTTIRGRVHACVRSGRLHPPPHHCRRIRSQAHRERSHHNRRRRRTRHRRKPHAPYAAPPLAHPPAGGCCERSAGRTEDSRDVAAA
jgi:hypothetical protein